MHGHVITVQNWLEALPNRLVRADGGLATYLGWAMVLTGSVPQAEQYAQVAARRDDLGPETRGRLLVLQGFIALLYHRDDERAIVLAQAALEMLDTDSRWRVLAMWVLAEAQERTGRITEAIALLREARLSVPVSRDDLFVIAMDGFLAGALNANGQRRAALALCLERIEEHERSASEQVALPALGLIYSWLGTLYYKADQLKQARAYSERGLALCQQMSLGGDLVFAYGIMAPICYAQGEIEKAFEMIVEARHLA